MDESARERREVSVRRYDGPESDTYVESIELLDENGALPLEPLARRWGIEVLIVLSKPPGCKVGIITSSDYRGVLTSGEVLAVLRYNGGCIPVASAETFDLRERTPAASAAPKVLGQLQAFLSKSRPWSSGENHPARIFAQDRNDKDK